MTTALGSDVRNFNIVLLKGKRQIFETLPDKLSYQHEALRKRGLCLHQHLHFTTRKGRVSLYVFSHNDDQRGLTSVEDARQLACRLVGAPLAPVVD